MRTWTFTETQINDAAKLVGVTVYNLRKVTKKAESHRFTLHTAGIGSKYRRKSSFGRGGETVTKTIPGAVCWHGHRDFMRALFTVEEYGRIQTALADYKGRDDFERSFPFVNDYSNEYQGNGYVDRETFCVCDE